MDLRERLLKSSSFTLDNNVFYQKGISRSTEFETTYLTIREKEGRIYPDGTVQNLPEFPNALPQQEEWKARNITMHKLISYLSKRKSSGPILELGSGNGWLTHQLAGSLKQEVSGMDINEHELLQGARLFKSSNLVFIYGDIFSADVGPQTFDAIILSSSVQYFSDVKQLMNRLLELLKPSGEIHVVDSPLYKTHKDAQDAKERSQIYFKSIGIPEMTKNYFHHTLMDFNFYNYRVLFDQRSPMALLKRMILRKPQMAFPWILIKQN